MRERACITTPMSPELLSANSVAGVPSSLVSSLALGAVIWTPWEGDSRQ